MAIVSERTLNNGMYPIVPTQGKKVDFPVVMYDYSRPSFSTTGYWDTKCFMLMDFITTNLLKQHYGPRFPKGEELKLIKRKIPHEFAEKVNMKGNGVPDENAITISFDDHELQNFSEAFKNMSSKELHDLVERVSSCGIKMNYFAKVFSDKRDIWTFFKYSNLSHDLYQRLFTFVSENLSVKSDRIWSRKYTITFNSPIGMFFVHNVLGVVALLFAYELIRRSEQATGTYQMRHFLPSEYVKGKHFDAMNQFPVTLEEEMVQKMVPLVDNSVPVYTNFKPVMDKLHHAAKL